MTEMGDIFYGDGKEIKFRNPAREKMPNPCPDCGRSYLKLESVAVQVEGRATPVWTGCIDCWLRRTSINTGTTFEGHPVVTVRLEDLKTLLYAFDHPEATALGSRPFIRLRDAVKDGDEHKD